MKAIERSVPQSSTRADWFLDRTAVRTLPNRRIRISDLCWRKCRTFSELTSSADGLEILNGNIS